jgi:predicted transcriptional regulator of viral defense system
MSTISKSKFDLPLQVQETLRDKNIALFTARDISRLFRLSAENTKYFLETYTKRGLFARVKQGLYTLKNDFPREEVVANALYKPSYISLEYALAKYGIIPESPYTVTSVTTKIPTSFTIKGRDFSYTKIKNKAFTGYTPTKIDEHTVFLAEPEKALADYLYLVSLGKKTLNDRLDVSRVDKEKTYEYAKLFDRKGLMKVLGDAWELATPVIM